MKTTDQIIAGAVFGSIALACFVWLMAAPDSIPSPPQTCVTYERITEKGSSFETDCLR